MRGAIEFTSGSLSVMGVAERFCISSPLDTLPTLPTGHHNVLPRFDGIGTSFKTSALAGGKVHNPVPIFILAELASTCAFQNHQYYCRGVAKIDFCEKVKNCYFALMATYGQHGLNTTFRKVL